MAGWADPQPAADGAASILKALTWRMNRASPAIK
jgi:hypothetical protein